MYLWYKESLTALWEFFQSRDLGLVEEQLPQQTT